MNTIVFDAVGTLIRPRESISAVYQRHAPRYGTTLDTTVIKRRFGQARFRLFPNRPGQISSHQIERDIWKQLVQLVFPRVQHPEKLFDELWQYYARPDAWILFDDVVSCLNDLWNNQLTVAIASNFDRRLCEICRNISPLNRIKLVFCSADVGYRKPDPRFYTKIGQKLACPDQKPGRRPPAITMVGDDFCKDVAAPRLAGWRSVHLDRSQHNLGDLCESLNSFE